MALTRGIISWGLALPLLWVGLPGAHAQPEEVAPPAPHEDVTPAAGVKDNERAVEMLVDRLSHADSYKVRAQAAVLLGRLGGQRAVPDLMFTLQNDEHFVVRTAAATALGVLRDERAVEPLFAGVADDESIVRDASSKALQRLDARRCFDTLVRYAREGTPDQRRVAVTRLGDMARVGDEAAIDVLVMALGDDPTIRDASSQGLSDLPTDRAVPILVRALQSDNLAIRAEAARLLGQRQDTRAVEALSAAYERVGEQERVRGEIRRSLEQLRGLVNMTQLIGQARGAQDKDQRIRAMRLLGVVGDPRTASVLEGLLGDPDPYVQGTAAQALADLGSTQSIPRLEAALAAVDGTRAHPPVANALKKLKRIQAQSR
jgi:HEAT repeat protein